MSNATCGECGASMEAMMLEELGYCPVCKDEDISKSQLQGGKT